MEQIEPIFYHKECLEVIRWINKRKWGTFAKTSSPIHGTKGVVRNTEKSLILNFKYHITKDSFKKIHAGRALGNIGFNPTKTKYKLMLRDVYLRSYSPPKFEAVISSLHSKGFSKNRLYYFKLFIPLSKDLNFHHQLELTNFTSDTGLMSSESVIANINGTRVAACLIKDKDVGKKYLCIEANEKLNFDSFSDKAHAVRNALGYLTGYLSGGRAYYFAFSDGGLKKIKAFHYTEIRSEIKSGYSPVNSNPFSWIRTHKSEAHRYYSKKLLRKVSQYEFSSLCQRLHDDMELTTVLLLILESSVASLTFMPGGFAIALEMLSDIITGEKKLKLNPVHDKTLSKKIRTECLNIIEKYKADISEDAAKIFTNKINGLNQVTNSARLRAPFITLGIPLAPADLEIIDTRNDFLHGKVPDITKSGKHRPLKRVNNDLYYASMRLYTLPNMIILKWMGYDDYVLNFPKIQEHFSNQTKREALS